MHGGTAGSTAVSFVIWERMAFRRVSSELFNAEDAGDAEVLWASIFNDPMRFRFCDAIVSFAPSGLMPFCSPTHRWRGGLHSFAPSELSHRGVGGSLVSDSVVAQGVVASEFLSWEYVVGGCCMVPLLQV